MSTIGSPIKEIEKLWFEVLPSGRPIKATSVIRHDGTIVVIGADGKLYTNRLKEHAFYGFSNWPWLDGVLRGLRAAKVLSPEAVKQHLDLAAASERRRSMQYKAQNLKDASEGLGIKLTSAQKRQLAKHLTT